MAFNKKTFAFSEVINVYSLKINQPENDSSIWNYAKANGYTIVTKDDDFEKIVLLKKAPPKLIYLKTFNLNTNKISNLILQNKNSITSFINPIENDILEIYTF
ncbi:DUF5615 family PIN-like protein [Flavobacterium sp.]|uniref:DUF5615 family PIN-like protein n=1 Tax=Flavobacterium sp. TaxID=239 RepID=UPI003751C9DB